MGLFRASAPTSVQVSDAGTPLRVTAAATGKPWSLWADGLGTFAIRALQILLAVLLIAAVMIGIGQLIMNQNQQRQTKVIAIFAALAIALTCVGLFGLAAFSAEQRSREVAMRKVLGAGRFSLVNLLAREYIKLMAISAVLAIPATFWALDSWLAEFSVRISQNPLWYLLAAAATFAICWCTVATLAWQVAGRKPAMVLRQQ